MRVLFSSNGPHSPTGYGNQTKHLLPAIKALGYEIACVSWWGVEGGPLEYQGIKLFPKHLDAYGNDAMPYYARTWKADILITLIDLWVLDDRLGHLGHTRWCVPADTPIQLPDGSTVPIETIGQPGGPKKIMGERDGQLVEADVSHFHIIDGQMAGEVLAIELDNGNSLEVTAENAIARVGAHGLEWRPAACLLPGDVVYCYTSRPPKGEADGNAGDETDRGAQAGIDRDRMGLSGGDSGRRGYYLDSPSVETRAQGSTPSYPATDPRGNEYQPRTLDLVGTEDRHASRFSQPAAGNRREPPEAASGGLLSSPIVGLSGLSRTEADSAVPGRQATTGETRTRVLRKPSDPIRESLQSAILPAGTEPLATGTGLELARVNAISRRGRPYPHVYDLTTSTGNFFAGGILIHNCPWFPIDHADPIPADIAKKFPHAHRLLVYSRWSEKLVKEYDGGKYAEKVDYLPHGIDCQTYHPATPEQKRAYRRHLFPDWPEDSYVFGMVAANKGYPCRKSFPEVIEAFSRFAARHPEARLYLHSMPGTEFRGPPLIDMARHYGVADKVRLAQPSVLLAGDYTDDLMREIYCSMDVLLSPSQGEGFGIPIVEAQANGVPVIVTDHSAMAEVCGSGWRVPPLRTTPSLIWGRFAEADVDGILHAMEEAYRRPKVLVEAMSRAAREFALQYDWPVVIRDYWAPWLARMDVGRRERALELEWRAGRYDPWPDGKEKAAPVLVPA